MQTMLQMTMAPNERSYYTSEIDGAFGPATVIAFLEWKKKKNAT